MDMNRTVRKNFRLTPREADMLAANARAAGTTESDYVRSLILDPVRIFAGDDDMLRAVYRELKRQGNNLNQMAWALNRRADSVGTASVEACLKDVGQATAMIAAIIADGSARAKG